MRELPEGGEWATIPLLDPANVGRYVWTVFNGNVKFASVHPIVKIGRTNVHVEVEGTRPWSMRINEDAPGSAGGVNGGGYMTSCHTEQHRIESAERRELTQRLATMLKFNTTRRVPIDRLRTAVKLLEED